MYRNRLLRGAGRLVWLGLLPIIAGGCGPRLTSADLGTIVREIPKVPGADKPYPMPQLDKPAAAEPAAPAEPATESEPQPTHDPDPSDSTTESQE
jgi:hypothetical protein